MILMMLLRTPYPSPALACSFTLIVRIGYVTSVATVFASELIRKSYTKLSEYFISSRTLLRFSYMTKFMTGFETRTMFGRTPL